MKLIFVIFEEKKKKKFFKKSSYLKNTDKIKIT